MANFYTDNDDLKFYIEKGINWKELVDLSENSYTMENGFRSLEEAKEFYNEILSLVGEFSAKEISPRAEKIDQQKITMKNGEVTFCPPLQEVFDKIKELELHGMCLPRELGGMNCPVLLYMINSELISRAEAAVMAHHGFHGGIAMAMLVYSIDEGSTEIDPESFQITKTRFEKEIKEIAEGNAWGSMDITEPDAGSDMAQLRCRAKEENGKWTLTGQKLFITSGHGKYHFVVARTEDPKGDDALAGLSGLSLFLVEAYTTDSKGKKKWNAKVNGIEKKLGHHGSATVSISFEDVPAKLVGKRGEGFRLMLLLMNNARVAVGFESLGVCEAAYRLALDYARQRPSMGKTIDQHEMIAEYLQEMKTDIQCIRALAMTAGFHEEMAQKLKIKYKLLPGKGSAKKALEKKLKFHQKSSREITPLLKYFGSESAVDMARKCVQIHGGVGYTTEYGAEKLLRDAMVFPIYEGTSQIQSLMAMKDNLLGAIKDPQKFAGSLAMAKTKALIAKNPREKQVSHISALTKQAITHLMTKIAVKKFQGTRKKPMTQWSEEFLKNWNPKDDFGPALLHAERLTKMLVDQKIADILWKQCQEHPERGDLLDRFLEQAVPRCNYMYQLITKTGSRILENLDSDESIPKDLSSQKRQESETATQH